MVSKLPILRDYVTMSLSLNYNDQEFQTMKESLYYRDVCTILQDVRRVYIIDVGPKRYE